MAGQAIAGTAGDVKISTTQVAETTKWKMTLKAFFGAYASNKTAGWKARPAVGVREATGTVEGKLDPTIPVDVAMAVGTNVTLKLYVNATAFWSVPAAIESLDFTVDIDTGDIIGWTANFSSNGVVVAPTYSMTMSPPEGDGEDFDPHSEDATSPHLDIASQVAETVKAEMAAAKADIVAAATQAAVEALARLMRHPHAVEMPAQQAA